MYLEDEMSAIQRADFEAELNANAELKGEFELQKEIIEGIKSARKTELKNMLNAVVIAPVWHQTLWFKSTIAIGFLTIAGAFFFWPQINLDENTDANNTVSIDTIPQEELSMYSELNSFDTPEETELITENNSVTQERKGTQKTSAPNQISTDPKKLVPNAGDISPLEEIGETDNTINNPSSNAIEESKSSFNVQIKDSHSLYNFHYQFKSEELLLFGNFDSTYEILDFQFKETRSLFLGYKGKYYSLDKENIKVSPLIEITDSELIKELNSVKGK